eukprot:240074_1
MATASVESIKYEDLLEFNHEQLLTSSMNLVDIAPTNFLKHCYENVFKITIMKYLLKNVIKQEIQTLSASNCDDWKRISLIKNIMKLTPYSVDQNVSSPKNSNDIMKHNNSKMNKYECSTDTLLLSGYIRNEMGIKNNDNNLSIKDILSICQYFINDCSNIVNPQQLIIYNHTNNSYQYVFSEQSTIESKRPVIKLINKPTMKIKLKNMSGSTYVKKKLIAPYKIMIENNSHSFYFDKIPHYNNPNATDISVNIQQIGPFIYDTEETKSSKRLLGVAQYFDIKRNRLLNFGGIKDTDHWIPTVPSRTNRRFHSTNKHEYTTQRGIVQFHLSSKYMFDGWEKLVKSSLIYKRGYMSLCDIKNRNVAVIGGEHRNQPPPVRTYTLPRHHTKKKNDDDNVNKIVNYVEVYNLDRDESVAINNLHHRRRQCGSYYNEYTQELIVFGGNKGVVSVSPVSRSMEIYDFHKNVWFDIPYSSKNVYDKYPCIWTVGSRCIFVACLQDKTKHPSCVYQNQCEWIDLRVCYQNRKNKSKFNTMNTMYQIDGDTSDSFSMFAM